MIPLINYFPLLSQRRCRFTRGGVFQLPVSQSSTAFCTTLFFSKEQNHSSVLAHALPKGSPLHSCIRACPRVPSSSSPKPPAGGNVGSVFKGCVTEWPEDVAQLSSHCCIFHLMHHLFIFMRSSVEFTSNLLMLVLNPPSFTGFLGQFCRAIGFWEYGRIGFH